MTKPSESGVVPLTARGVVEICGPETRTFLQGVITNDIEKVTPDNAIYAALLTPQGKFLFDFLIAQDDDRLLFDCDGATLADLVKRLSMYRLRAKVEIKDISASYTVLAVIGDAARALAPRFERGAAWPMEGAVAFVDPRLADLGVRVIVRGSVDDVLASRPALKRLDLGAYERHRLALGVPEGGKDILSNKAFLIESNFDELHGVDHKKGCYIGQETTSRTKRKAEIRKRLLPVDFDGPAPAPGTTIEAGRIDLGTVHSSYGTRAIALVRLDRLDEAAGEIIHAGGTRARIAKPEWIFRAHN